MAHVLHNRLGSGGFLAEGMPSAAGLPLEYEPIDFETGTPLDGPLIENDPWSQVLRSTRTPGGADKPKIVLAQDVDYPPYATLDVSTPDGNGGDNNRTLGGFAIDFARGIETLWPDAIEFVFEETSWSNCWGDDDRIGPGLMEGSFDGCMSYTNAAGVRQRYLGFTHSILSVNKPAGILARLDANGKPEVSPRSNLSGEIVADVGGWAPTEDTLELLTNPCTGERFHGFEIKIPAEMGNDSALKMLLDGTVDAVYIYADQAEHYKHECEEGRAPPPNEEGAWDCAMWNQFGTTFAYVQTGLEDYMMGGTTLSMHPKGSGLSEILNPLVDRFLDTPEYYELCKKHDLVSSCLGNGYFPEGATDKDYKRYPYFKNTRDLPESASCATGYCQCHE